MSNIIPRKVPSWEVKTPVRNAVNQASEKTPFFFSSGISFMALVIKAFSHAQKSHPVQQSDFLCVGALQL